MNNQAGQQTRTAIHNVRVFDGKGLTEPRTVAIDGSLISSDASGATEVIDGNNGILIPGLIDAHVHVHNETHLAQLAKHGITTALDMAMWPEPKMRRLRDQAPDILTAGLPATKAGSVHSCALPLPDEAFLSKPEEAEQWVQKRIDEGSDYIKIIADVPGPSQEVMNAIVREAHRHQKMVVAHAAAFIPTMMALEAGVDAVTHTSLDKAVDIELAERIRAANVISIPTLTMMRETTKQLSFSDVAPNLLKFPLLLALFRSKRRTVGKETYANGKESVANMYRAGVPILAGTDCHEEPSSMFDVQHGESLHRELELLVDAGMSTADVLRAATSVTAECFGLSDRGVIEAGRRADLVLLSQDPLHDIRATRTIQRVWCAGKQIN